MYEIICVERLSHTHSLCLCCLTYFMLLSYCSTTASSYTYCTYSDVISFPGSIFFFGSKLFVCIFDNLFDQFEVAEVSESCN